MSFDLKLGAGALAIGSSGTATNNFILRAYPGTGAISPAAGEIGLYRGNDQAESATIFTVDAAGKMTHPATSTAGASVNLPHGTAPTSPVNGDMWTTTAGLFVRINGVTVGPLT